jgi:hypothetical protein
MLYLMKKIILLLTFVVCTNLTFGQQTDCSQTDGTFSYYALLIIDNIPNDFSKTDFINHIVSLDNVSNEDLTILNDNLTEVFKSFPTAQSEYLQRVVSVNSNVEIYPILTELTNSIEYHECTGEGTILGLNDNEYLKNIVVYPNPITENSVVEFKMTQVEVSLEIFNNLGQKIFEEKVFNDKIFIFKKVKLKNGIYFLKIKDLNNRKSEILKIVKK